MAMKDIITPEERKMIDEWIAGRGVTRCKMLEKTSPVLTQEEKKTLKKQRAKPPSRDWMGETPW